MRVHRPLLAVLCLACLAAAPAPASAPAFAATPAEIRWFDFPGRPGVKIALLEGRPDQPGPFTFRLKYYPGYFSPPHHEESTEYVTVLSGTLYVGLGEDCTRANGKALPAGSFALIPAGQAHSVWTEEEVVVQLHGQGPFTKVLHEESCKKD